MSDPKPEQTQLEVAQLLQDFIDARIRVFNSRHLDIKTFRHAIEDSDKLFNQIAGIE